jgi:hypothetical protein
MISGKFAGNGFSSSVSLYPKCAKAPCSAVVGRFAKGGVTFKRIGKSGTAYKASATTSVTCGQGEALAFSMKVYETWSFRVLRADYVDGVWTATAIHAASSISTPGGQNSSSSLFATNTLTCHAYSHATQGTMVRVGAPQKVTGSGTGSA